MLGTFTYGDATGPKITAPATNLVVEAESGTGNLVAYQKWLSGHGGASAIDTHSDETELLWTYKEESTKPVSGGEYKSCATNTARRVMFAVRDQCGHVATTAATFTVVDTTPPVLGCNNNHIQRCDVRCRQNVAFDAWLNRDNGGLCISDVSPYTVCEPLQRVSVRSMLTCNRGLNVLLRRR